MLPPPRRAHLAGITIRFQQESEIRDSKQTQSTKAQMTKTRYLVRRLKHWVI
jgi:hypothetical protein